MKRTYQLFCILLLSVIVVGCGQDKSVTADDKDGNGDELTPVTFSLDWTPNTNHTGIYVARELGYFEEQGLDVEIILPGEVAVNQLIAAEKVDFGVSFQQTVTEARAEGLPVVSISAIIQHNTSGYASPADRGITGPKDFEGKKFGSIGTDLAYVMMKTLMEKHDADIDKVEFITTGDSDFFVAFERDVDFSGVFYAWTGIEAELRDIDLNMVYFSDSSEQLDFYAPILATSEEMIESDPETVEAFVHAAVKGYEYAIDNPEEAAAILIESEPDLDPDLVRKSQEWLSPRYQDDAEQFGIQEKERWQSFTDFMFENDIIKEDLDVEKAFTNDFLPSK